MEAIKSESGYYDDFELSTGKYISANCSKLGIDPNLNLSGGYDDGIDSDDFTPTEKMEIAQYAICLWQRYWDEARIEQEARKTASKEKEYPAK